MPAEAGIQSENSRFARKSEAQGFGATRLVRQAADWRWSSYGYYATSDNVLLEIDVAAND